MAALTGCLLIAGSSQAMAVQRYASPSGSGSACKQMSPCAIQIAASGANMGDEVIVAPGDYSPPGSVITAVPNVYIHGVLGQPMPRIHFTAGFLGIITSGDRGSWLAVDAITSAALETENGGSADMIVSHVTGANAQACYDYSTLTNSVCWESGANGTGAEAQTGTTDTITMRNVTLEATGSGGIGARIQADTGGNVTANLTNVIARGTSGDLTLVQQGGATLVANIDHANRGVVSPGGATVNETNPQTAAPLLVNPATGDFRELAGSPTIDTGITNAANGPFDFLGKPRVINGLTDIGADEFDPFTGVAMRNAKSRVKKRRAGISIGCPAGTPTSCTGTLTLAFGKKTAGSSAFSIRSGATQRVKVKISKPAFKKLNGEGKLATQATAAAIDGAGISASTSATLKLKL